MNSLGYLLAKLAENGPIITKDYTKATDKVVAEWKKASRANRVNYTAAPDPNSKHVGIMGDKIRTVIHRLKTGKPNKKALHTNHQRVVAARAKRMGISVNEYAAKFK